jgi:glutathione S-transferase
MKDMPNAPMKLYSGPLSMFGAKAEIAAHEKGMAIEIEHVPFSLGDLYEPKHPEVLRINPKAQVPVLIDGDLELYDSTQIFEYFEDAFPSPALWPANPRERARARLLELQSDEVFFPLVTLLMPNQRAKAGEEAVAEGTRSLHEYYDRMEERLGRAEYLAGDFTYADIAFYMAQFFATFLGEPWRDRHPNLDAWKARLGERESIARVAGTFPARPFRRVVRR